MLRILRGDWLTHTLAALGVVGSIYATITDGAAQGAEFTFFGSVLGLAASRQAAAVHAGG